MKNFTYDQIYSFFSFIGDDKIQELSDKLVEFNELEITPTDTDKIDALPNKIKIL
jgi:hypothetical protein